MMTTDQSQDSIKYSTDPQVIFMHVPFPHRPKSKGPSMRFLLVLCLLATGGALASPVHAASHGAARSIPVVATWFSSLHPKAGQQETVTVQFFQGKKMLSGAPLTVALKIGTKTITRLKGTRTNKKGEAWAKFTVPKAARGKTLWAYTSLAYHHQVFQGNNRVQVAK